jgi:hypothetical protein
MRDWIWATIFTLFVAVVPTTAWAQIAVYPMDVCKEWSAWYNTQPPGSKALHVTGVCTFHTSGYQVKLVRRKSKDIKTGTCILDLAITGPIGIGGIERGIPHYPVRYSEQTEQQCDSVSIEPDHITVAVKLIR